LNVLTSLLNITGNIESVSGSLRDGKTVVEGNAAWNGAETTFSSQRRMPFGRRDLHDNTPHLVNSKLAFTLAGGSLGTEKERLLEA
jgi:hypothetical protein